MTWYRRLGCGDIYWAHARHSLFSCGKLDKTQAERKKNKETYTQYSKLSEDVVSINNLTIITYL